MSHASQKILVVHIAGLARTTLALPALRALRQTLPSARITVVCSNNAAELIRLGACADEILPLRRLRDSGLIRPRASYLSLKTFNALRRESFDLAIELERGAEAGLALFAAQPKQKLRDAEKGQSKLKQLLGRVAEFFPGKLALPKHAAHRYLETLAPLGVFATESEPRIFTDRAADERIEKRLKKIGFDEKLLVGIHPGAGKGKPHWQLEHFADVASRLIHVMDARIIILGGRSEKSLAKQLQAMLPPKRAAVFDAMPLTETVSTLARLSVLIANHSGPAHLAGAVGTPVVAATASAKPTPYDLLGKHHQHVRAAHIDAVSADEIYEAACRLLNLSRAELLVTR